MTDDPKKYTIPTTMMTFPSQDKHSFERLVLPGNLRPNTTQKSVLRQDDGSASPSNRCVIEMVAELRKYTKMDLPT